MKLIAVDIDGTLVNDDKIISQRTKDTFKKILEAGHKVCIASGRSFYGTVDFAKELGFDKYGGLLSNFNGAKITEFKTGKELFNHTLPLKLVKEVLTFIKPLNIGYLIYYKDKIYVDDLNTYALDEGVKFNKINYIYRPNLINEIDFEPNNILFTADPQLIGPDADKIYDNFKNEGTLTYSGPYYYEIMPKGITKGTSLIEIANYYGIKHEDIIAFGDQMNDTDMILKAGIGVAMDNATDNLKKIADYITLSNNDDGVADYLERFVL